MCYAKIGERGSFNAFLTLIAFGILLMSVYITSASIISNKSVGYATNTALKLRLNSFNGYTVADGLIAQKYLEYCKSILVKDNRDPLTYDCEDKIFIHDKAKLKAAIVEELENMGHIGNCTPSLSRITIDRDNEKKMHAYVALQCTSSTSSDTKLYYTYTYRITKKVEYSKDGNYCVINIEDGSGYLDASDRVEMLTPRP